VFLPVPCQYLFLLVNFIVNSEEIFQTNLSVHHINTRNKYHLHRPDANLSCFLRSTLCDGIIIFTSLPYSQECYEWKDTV